MTHKKQRSIEIICLSALVLLTLLGICWGDPPLPPADEPRVPVGNAAMSALTIFGMAAYGVWKMRK